MKKCPHCGHQVADEAVVCPACGSGMRKKVSDITIAAKVFMVLGTVFMAIYLAPLIWCIPMTVSYFQMVKNGKPVSTAFKICSLLLVNPVAGILMFCDKEE